MKAVDLGLSVKWADCNIGAGSPIEDGRLYEWKEIVSKTNGNNTLFAPVGIPSEWKMDIAEKELGEGWRVPTKDQMDELVEACNFEFVLSNGKKLLKFTGLNGNSIYFPTSGCENNYGLRAEGGFYWTSTSVPGINGNAYHMRFTEENIHRGYNRIIIHEAVRPVYVEKLRSYEKLNLRSLINEVDIYCQSTKNAVLINNIESKSYFYPEVRNWKHEFKGRPTKVIYRRIALLARRENLNMNWEEFDVDGFCWHIGIFSLICEKAGLVSSFEEAFKESYKLYIESGLQR